MLEILKKNTILYVEDEVEILKNIKEYLESYFLKVYTAQDGKKAYELFNKYKPDVLILDINIPLLNGLDLANKIREKDKNVKIIILSAYSDKDKLLFATALKLTKYLIKPVSPKLFKETLELLALEIKNDPCKFLRISMDCLWDKEEEHLLINSQVIELSQKEHLLLKLFVKNKGFTVTYEDIMFHLWEDSYEKEISIDSVKNQVSHLRKKLPENCLISVYGKGYILN